MKFYSLFFIVPIYGLICNIVTIGLLNKPQIECQCKIEGFDEEINKLLDSQYSDITTTCTVISSFTIVFNIFCLIALLCLRSRENKYKTYNASTIIVPIAPMQQEIAPVYQRANHQKLYKNMIQTPNSFSGKRK